MKDKTLFYNRMQDIYKDEYDEFLKALEDKPISSFYINSLKDSKENIFHEIGFKYKEGRYNPDSYYYEDVQIGKTIANDLGLIYPQEMSASIPSLILNPKENSCIVDMCSAPGGKSINLACISKDSGILISNEYEYKRAMILTSNLERMGISNVIVTNKNGDDLAVSLMGVADYVLLDAPCSGEGMIRKNHEIIDNYSMDNIELCSLRQKQLIENAYDILKEGGYLVYSTCTYAKEENEDIVHDFLKRHEDMELMTIDNRFIRRGINDPNMVRFTVLDGTEGQFVSLMRKNSAGFSKNMTYKKPVRNKIIEEFIKENLCLDEYYVYEQNGYYYMSLKPLWDLGKNVLRYGIYIGEIKKNIFYPSHNLFRSNALRNCFKKVIELNDEEYLKYRSGLNLYHEDANGYYLLTYHGYAFAYTKATKGDLKNKYPKGLRY